MLFSCAFFGLFLKEYLLCLHTFAANKADQV
jgi:hypothetical protein